MMDSKNVERGNAAVADLKPAPYNPRSMSKKAKERLSASVSRWGLVQELVVNRRTGHVVGGHQRLAVLISQGVETTPVCWVDLDEREEKALNIALNSPTLAGEYDDDALVSVLADIENLENIEVFGLDELVKLVPIIDCSPQLGAFEYRVIIEGLDEQKQAALVEDLEKRGYKCKAMIS